MCGIAGIVHFGKMNSATESVVKMTNALSHRGPDASGYYNEHSISLGHRRLSIIDLDDKANQPFIDISSRYVLCFNGEIYNYKSLKQELNDYSFSTNSDTEVLLAAFYTWGISCLDKLDGMFAFSIWDKQTETLWIARDRLGVKPLYFFGNHDGFLFSSEIRGLLASEIIPPELEHFSISEYLAYQSVSNIYPIIKNIKELKPGSFLKLTRYNIDIQQYWKPSNKKISLLTKTETVQKEVFNLFSDSISKRLVADVPIASFLSGGMDSSAVVALMSLHSSSPIQTFTLGFSESEFDESSYASIIAKRFNTNHTTHLLHSDELLQQVLSGLDAMDSPSADGINTYLLSNAIKSANIKVAMSGIGGDELFAGYPGFNYFDHLHRNKTLFNNTYFFRKGISNLFSGSSSNKINRAANLMGIPKADIASFYPLFRQGLSTQRVSQLIYCPSAVLGIQNELSLEQNEIQSFDSFSQYSIAEYMGYSSSTLLKDADQMSMAVGLEIREPFFDYRLIEYILALPNEFKQHFNPKQLLADAMEPLLPKEIVNRKKKGFVLPWKNWMKNELFSFCESQIHEFSERDFVQKENLVSYWKRFAKEDPAVKWIQLWQFVVLNHWMNKNGIEYKA
jgi:asparagine synthase (glutamine-hydrolysing)